MIFKVRQTRINYVTGNESVIISKKSWKTRVGAENHAQKYCRWRCRPCGGEVTEESDAEVIEVGAK